jgi:hypothetical protein
MRVRFWGVLVVIDELPVVQWMRDYFDNKNKLDFGIPSLQQSINGREYNT